jgi:hypothetical protein
MLSSGIERKIKKKERKEDKMKKLLLLTMVIGLLVGGCSSYPKGGRSYWTKDGIQVSSDFTEKTSEQLQKAIFECEGPPWTKFEMKIEEYQKDVDFCKQAQVARHRHVENAKWLLVIGVIATGGGPIPSLESLDAGYFERCMVAKGYNPSDPNTKEQCMKDKGYVWVEEK